MAALLATLAATALLSAERTAAAGRPIPYFAGADTLGLYCPPVSDVRAIVSGVCDHLAEFLRVRHGRDVVVGPDRLSDPNVLFVIVNVYPVRSPAPDAEPAGEVLVLFPTFYRAGHVNPLLVGPAPVLLSPSVTARGAAEEAAKRLATAVAGYVEVIGRGSATPVGSEKMP